MKISCLKAVANFFYASHKLLFMYGSSYAVIFQSSNFNVPNFIVCILFLNNVVHYKSMKVYILHYSVGYINVSLQLGEKNIFHRKTICTFCYMKEVIVVTHIICMHNIGDIAVVVVTFFDQQET